MNTFLAQMEREMQAMYMVFMASPIQVHDVFVFAMRLNVTLHPYKGQVGGNGQCGCHASTQETVSRWPGLHKTSSVRGNKLRRQVG